MHFVIFLIFCSSTQSLGIKLTKWWICRNRGIWGYQVNSFQFFSWIYFGISYFCWNFLVKIFKCIGISVFISSLRALKSLLWVCPMSILGNICFSPLFLSLFLCEVCLLVSSSHQLFILLVTSTYFVFLLCWVFSFCISLFLIFLGLLYCSFFSFLIWTFKQLIFNHFKIKILTKFFPLSIILLYPMHILIL